MKLRELARKIKRVEIQGAREIALESLKFLLEFAKRKGIDERFFEVGEYLKDLRPTAVVLYNCVEVIRKDPRIETIERLIGELKRMYEIVGAVGEKIIKEGDIILTHCHSSEVIKVFECAWKNGKFFEVVATRTEPLHQGLKTVRDLKKIGIPVTLIVDGAISSVIENVDKILVGSDAIRKEGFVNKIGTKTIAIIAKYYRKKFYVIGDSFKIDRRKELKIEKRPGREIAKIKGVEILNLAFDLTPWKFVDRVIIEKGIFEPRQIISRFKL